MLCHILCGGGLELMDKPFQDNLRIDPFICGSAASEVQFI